MLENKVALITGASGGIGRAIALAYAKQGADLAIHYNGNEAKALQVKDEIEALGRKAVIYQADVSDFTAAKEMIQAAKKEFGHLDILVNNAGITRDGLLMGMSEENFDAVIDTNLKGTFNCIRWISRIMMKQKAGKIINVSSVSGVFGNVGQANYSASKAGIIGLTKSVAKELASRNITANAIAPGFVDTEMTAVLPEEVKDEMKKQIPLGRIARPEDIANAAVFLASDMADYITGQTLIVDGGMIM